MTLSNPVALLPGRTLVHLESFFYLPVSEPIPDWLAQFMSVPSNRGSSSVGPALGTLASPLDLIEPQTLGPTPHLLTEILRSEAQQSVSTRLPGDPDVYERLGTTDFQP